MSWCPNWFSKKSKELEKPEEPEKLAEFILDEDKALTVLELLDAYSAKQSQQQTAFTEKYMLWKKILELVPEMQQVPGPVSWTVDTSNILTVKIVGTRQAK
jgi:cell division septal protein FtsQ